ncbi:unnamed protein product [Alopecurus aequalis]
MKQTIVIEVSMSCDKSRRKAMTTAAKTAGVISVKITGDERDKLEVVGDNVDPVSLVGSLRKKLVHANIVKVEEVQDKKPEEKKEEQKKEKDGKPTHCYPGYYYHHQYPSHMLVCDEPTYCAIM